MLYFKTFVIYCVIYDEHQHYSYTVHVYYIALKDITI